MRGTTGRGNRTEKGRKPMYNFRSRLSLCLITWGMLEGIYTPPEALQASAKACHTKQGPGTLGQCLLGGGLLVWAHRR